MKARKTAAGMIAFLLVFALLFSLLFLVAEAGHDCASDDCAICRIIAVAEDVLKKAALLFCAAAVAVVVCLSAAKTLPALSAARRNDTPVLLRVKLSN